MSREAEGSSGHPGHSGGGRKTEKHERERSGGSRMLHMSVKSSGDHPRGSRDGRRRRRGRDTRSEGESPTIDPRESTPKRRQQRRRPRGSARRTPTPEQMPREPVPTRGERQPGRGKRRTRTPKSRNRHDSSGSAEKTWTPSSSRTKQKASESISRLAREPTQEAQPPVPTIEQAAPVQPTQQPKSIVQPGKRKAKHEQGSDTEASRQRLSGLSIPSQDEVGVGHFAATPRIGMTPQMSPEKYPHFPTPTLMPYASTTSLDWRARAVEDEATPDQPVKVKAIHATNVLFDSVEIMLGHQITVVVGGSDTGKSRVGLLVGVSYYIIRGIKHRIDAGKLGLSFAAPFDFPFLVNPEKKGVIRIFVESNGQERSLMFHVSKVPSGTNLLSIYVDDDPFYSGCERFEEYSTIMKNPGLSFASLFLFNNCLRKEPRDRTSHGSHTYLELLRRHMYKIYSGNKWSYYLSMVRIVFPQIEDFGFELTGGKASDGHVYVYPVVDGERQVEMYWQSTALKALLVILNLFIYDKLSFSILFIDDIESAFDVSLLARLAIVLRTLSSNYNTHVIISSRDAQIGRFFSTFNLLLLSKTGAKSLAFDDTTLAPFSDLQLLSLPISSILAVIDGARPLFFENALDLDIFRAAVQRLSMLPQSEIDPTSFLSKFEPFDLSRLPMVASTSDIDEIVIGDFLRPIYADLIQNLLERMSSLCGRPIKGSVICGNGGRSSVECELFNKRIRQFNQEKTAGTHALYYLLASRHSLAGYLLNKDVLIRYISEMGVFPDVGLSINEQIETLIDELKNSLNQATHTELYYSFAYRTPQRDAVRADDLAKRELAASKDEGLQYLRFSSFWDLLCAEVTRRFHVVLEPVSFIQYFTEAEFEKSFALFFRQLDRSQDIVVS